MRIPEIRNSKSRGPCLDPLNNPHMATPELCIGFPACLIQGGRKLTQSLRIAIYRLLGVLLKASWGVLRALWAVSRPSRSLLERSCAV